MSRVGKKPIVIPKGVTVSWQDGLVTIKGPKGELTTRTLPGIEIDVDPAEVRVRQTSSLRTGPAFHGLTRALLHNQVVGVSEGFRKVLEIHGTGYRATLAGRTLTLALGYSHQIEYPLPTGIECKVETPTKVEITGIDKQLVGQVASELRRLRKPEPYKGKGVRYEGEHIRRKAGKSAGA